MKRRIVDPAFLAAGPIDLVGRKAEIIRAAGFSLLELERAGMTLEHGRALGLTIDTGRTNGVGANVMRLRELMASTSGDRA
jgi:ribosomal protein L13E